MKSNDSQPRLLKMPRVTSAQIWHALSTCQDSRYFRGEEISGVMTRQGISNKFSYAAFTPGHMSPGHTYHGRPTCVRIHVDGYMLLVRDTCRLYLGDIITIRLCHGRFVSLCIQQQTRDKLATILSPIQDTCRRRQVDTSGYSLYPATLYPGANAALEITKKVLVGWVLVIIRGFEYSEILSEQATYTVLETTVLNRQISRHREKIESPAIRTGKVGEASDHFPVLQSQNSYTRWRRLEHADAEWTTLNVLVTVHYPYFPVTWST